MRKTSMKRDIIELTILVLVFFATMALWGSPPVLVTLDGEPAHVEIADSMFYNADTIEVRNYDLLANLHSNPIDFSCVSVVGDNRKIATLIEPDTAITCAHFHALVGDVLTFGDTNAIVVSVEISPNYGVNNDFDYCLLHLDRELPIKCAILAPVDWYDYFRTEGSGVTVIYTSIKTSTLNNLRYLADKQLFGFRGSGSPVGYRHGDDFVIIGLLISSGGQMSYPQEFDLTRGWIRGDVPNEAV